MCVVVNRAGMSTLVCETCRGERRGGPIHTPAAINVRSRPGWSFKNLNHTYDVFRKKKSVLLYSIKAFDLISSHRR